MFTYLINFSIPEDKGFFVDEADVFLDINEKKCFSYAGLRCRAFGWLNNDINKDNAFAIIGDASYATQEAALAEGAKITDALRLVSLRRGLGAITTDRGKPQNFTVTGAVDLLHSGVNVVSDEKSMMMGLSMSFIVPDQMSIFFDEIKADYDNDIIIPAPLRAAIEVVNSSIHEKLPWSKLLLCMDSIEMVVAERESDPSFIAALDTVMNCAKEVMKKHDPKLRDRVLSRLGLLRKDSIKNACRAEITEYLGEERGKEFNIRNVDRSKIAHGDIFMSEGEHMVDVKAAYALARDFLLAKLAKQHSGHTTPDSGQTTAA